MSRSGKVYPASFFSYTTLKESYYTEPYRPYVMCGICHACANMENPEFTRMESEGKEDGFKLYVRLVCPLHPEHNGSWSYHAKRPLRFRIKKILKRFVSID